MCIITTFCLPDAVCLHRFTRYVLLLHKYVEIASLDVFNRRYASASKIILTKIQLTAHQVKKMCTWTGSTKLPSSHTPFPYLLDPTILHQDILKRQQAKSNAPVFITFNNFRIIFLPARTMIPTMTPIMIAIIARTRSATPRWPWRKGLEWRFTRRRLTGRFGVELGGAGPTVGIW